MKENQLKQYQKLSDLILDTSKKELEKLEQEISVQKYLIEKKNIEKETEYQKFIHSLEIGEDETVFGPIESKSRAFSNTHYSFSTILKNALTLKFLEYININGIIEKNEPLNISITYDEIIKYSENARNILTEMKYQDQDILFKNPYNLEIYNNPKNNTVTDLKKLLPIFPENLRNSYNVSHITTNQEYQYFNFSDKASSFQWTSYQKLTPREKNAFFGTAAQRALKILPFEIEKSSQKTYIKR